ncbi:biotin-dependent carboxyltransferase family protein [Liquorilactobacillus capillatus]|uniref:Carboxyltransferase domain-containing protein n=1 Tax=Liquorilactobacillus capillatus DSM 19910 TaxID=1423731 RepID=A0A0R1MBU4_9LACO|nr:biotin-dependent carboxyltransferase family protein [Liquorilactobacillus capillatus]KRL01739.1 hypothetical protein FC81_GL001104 [Liquorilactobacillus capillatus DSM 19910]
MKTIEILDAGLATTIQDLGRPHYQAEGVPVSGAVDMLAYCLANLLVDNDEKAAALEFCFRGPKLRFLCTTFIAITGSKSQPVLDGQPLMLNKVYKVQKGQTLSFEAMISGRYGYLAVAGGGLLTTPVLASRSTTTRLKLGGLAGRILREGDHLPVHECLVLPSLYFREFTSEKEVVKQEQVMIRVLKGPQWGAFSPDAQKLFLEGHFSISQQADRMGYRLQGPKLPVPRNNMLSEGTILGNIQITREGLPIVLLADRQTTGGYPVIATVIMADLGKFVQLDSKKEMYFKLISLDEAVTAVRGQYARLKEFKQFLKQKRYQYPLGPARKTAQKIEYLLNKEK